MTKEAIEVRGMKFTPDQARAVKTLDQNLTINAGAGSGKTRVLTERYLDILLTPQSQGGLMYKEDALDRIVAITFTKKAAAEMKDRIRERLTEYLANNLIDSKENQEERDWVFKLLDNLSKAKISTIHSFCSDIIRNNLFELGIKADFSIMEGLEEKELQDEAISTVLEEIINEPEDRLYKELEEVTYLYGKRKLFKMLKEMLDNREGIENFLAENKSKDLHKVINKTVYDHNLKGIGDYLNDQELNEVMKELEGFISKNESRGVKVIKGILNDYPELISALNLYRESGKQEAENELLNLHFKFLNYFYDFDKDKEVKIGRAMVAADWEGGNEVKKAAYRKFETIKKIVFDKVPTVNDKPLIISDERPAEILDILLRLHKQVAKRYETLKEREGYLDYLDLEKRVVSAFSNNYDLVERLRRQIDFIMVDEFQDTNQTQWDIIRPLVTQDNDYKQLEEGKLFIVGDPKQSIYGFRRADVRIFNEVTRQITDNNIDNEKLVKLRKNFRSNKEIIDFINYLFNDIFPKDDEETSDYDVKYQDLTFGRNNKYEAKVDRDPDSHIELLLTQYFNDDEYSSAEYEAELIANKIEWLVEESDKQIFKDDSLNSVDYGDIAILMRSRTRLKDYEEALEKFNIPYRTVQGKGFYQRQEVYDIYLVLKALIYPEDEINTFGLFRSPLFALSDDQLFKLMIGNVDDDSSLLERIFTNHPKIKAKFDKWQRLKEEISIDRLINTILTDCGAYTTYLAGTSGEQRLANFKKLIAAAANFTQDQGNNLYLFLERLESLMEEEDKEGDGEVKVEAGNYVRLMTVHASKGKEFPVVFLADLNNAGNSRLGDFVCDEVNGREQVGFTYYNEALERDKTSSYGIIKDNLSFKDKMEGKRVFYVAATRTEEMLFLSGDVRIKSKGGITLNHSLKWLMQGLGYEEEDLVEFLDSEEEYKIEEIVGEYGKFNLIISKNPRQINEIEKEEEFEEVKEELAVEIEVDEFKLDPKVIFPSSLAEEESYHNKTVKDEVAVTKETDNKLNKIEVSFLKEKEATLKGTLVHEAIELLSTGNELNRDYLFNCHLEYTEYPGLRANVEEVIDKVEECPEFNEILESECRPEVEFYYKREGQPISGSIDLLFKDENDNWAVVDWKTNRIDNMEYVEQLVEEYRRQVEVYQEIVQEMTGQEKVKGYLYFTEADEGQRLVEVVNSLQLTVKPRKEFSN
ncbi:ATP-dependent exoDNAse (exonuclease V) beta subunit (contains helicase and exonuclease domains) [Candidatus Frackibacter sp. WG11]|uniref:UvrD-helicase domain-containing protein n=1 Tax=Candidatus Frackibacter sp. WG11 TaxID=2017976 RepID=UPI000881D616|nr:UvrD-helicase domain-containing protein [Candidatus Frackibacter sp. WG11]SDC28035.1 ATP-dependent exoDNAse (exonuclease V) beta subunit (contains helicase and exonuclease domains) [Candidatus Frackibacter sp. WG11]